MFRSATSIVCNIVADYYRRIRSFVIIDILTIISKLIISFYLIYN
jgi:hypothetical protein